MSLNRSILRVLLIAAMLFASAGRAVWAAGSGSATNASAVTDVLVSDSSESPSDDFDAAADPVEPTGESDEAVIEHEVLRPFSYCTKPPNFGGSAGPQSAPEQASPPPNDR